MGKTNTKTFAEAGLEDITELAPAAEEFVKVDTTSTDDEDNFQQVGGLEPVEAFYRLTAPKNQPKHPFKILEKGQTLTGVYERSFEAGKFNNKTYLIRMDDGKLYGLPSCTAISRAFEKLQETSKVKVTYAGMETIKGGEWAGNDAHAFTVLGNKVKA